MSTLSNEQQNTKKPFFYGWIIVAACMLIQAIPFGVAMNVQPQFINFVTNGEGFTLTQFSLVFTIGTVVSAIASPSIGSILSKPKTNIKLAFLIGAILSGGGYALNSLADDNLWAYYGIAAIVQVGTAIISAIGVPLLVNSWFKNNKGIAMGIAFSGGGIGNIFLQQIAARLLTNPAIGYSKAYFIFGMISMAVGIPVALFLVKLPKSESDLAGNIINKKDETQIKHTATWGYTFKEVTTIKLFWIFCIGFIFVGFYVSGLSVQYISYLYSIGLNASFVANVGSIFAFFSIFGNLCGGILFDKLGIKKSLILAGLMVITCALLLIFLPSINALGYLFAALLGISMFAYIIGPSYLTGALFGDKEFGTILGIVQVFFALGYAIGTVIFGLSVENLGYTTSWIIILLYSVIAYSCLLISCIGIEKHNRDINVIDTKRIS
ncbi:MAG: conjugated bile salt MFS transporter [Terrisporobacter sp.]|uniref:conjugated bile salt MFS transporter n=1 Tax=Terrisporobacter sp. TaxID=1965305 RepID=UPI002FCA74E3